MLASQNSYLWQLQLFDQCFEQPKILWSLHPQMTHFFSDIIPSVLIWYALIDCFPLWNQEWIFWDFWASLDHPNIAGTLCPFLWKTRDLPDIFWLAIARVDSQLVLACLSLACLPVPQKGRLSLQVLCVWCRDRLACHAGFAVGCMSHLLVLKCLWDTPRMWPFSFWNAAPLKKLSLAFDSKILTIQI